MKRYLIAITAFLFIASANVQAQGNSQGKGKDKQEKTQKGNQGKPADKPGLSGNPNAAQGNQKQNDNKQNNQGQGQGLSQKDEKVNKGQGNNAGKKDIIFQNDDNDRTGNSRKIIFNRDNFGERDKIRKQGKVTICHKFNRSGEQPVSISVSENAVQAHMNHGDVMGDCPDNLISDRKGFSEGFWRIRNRYYNTLYENQDQVIYSRSILDYALQRLSDARVQLVQYQSDPVLYQRRQALIVDLEQNTSLLETLIGTAAGYLAAKLID